MNVVSLLPGATETLYSLGVEPVGVSHECDHPPAAQDRPSVTAATVDTSSGDCATVDQAMQDATDDGSEAFRIDIATLDALDPDLIVTQGICDVCAVDTIAVEAAINHIDAEPRVLTTDPHSIEDVLDDIERLGRAVGRADRARRVVTDLEERIGRVERLATTAIDAGAERPRTVVLDWLDPVMVAGHWIPGLVDTAGGGYPLADAGARSQPREWDAIRGCDPEVVIAAPCGFDRDRTRSAVAALVERDGGTDIAAPADRAYAMDGNGLVNRPGPRLVDTLETFGRVLHPDVFGEPVRAIALSPRTRVA